MPDTILEVDHPRIISANLVEIGSVVSEEKIFFLISPPPFFLICIIGQNRQNFKVHKNSRKIYVKKAHHYAYTVQLWALSGLK